VAGIDGLLRLVIHEGADELHLGVDRAPKMFARGAPKRLSIPATSEETLRNLLGEILSPERERALRESGSCESTYDAAGLGAFRVQLTALPRGGFEAAFLHLAVHASVAASGAAATTAIAAPAARPAPEAAHPLAEAPARARPAPQLSSPSAARETRSGALIALVAQAFTLDASDLHLCEGEPASARVHGKLQRLQLQPIDALPELLGLDSDQRQRCARGEALDLALDAGEFGRLRAHVYPSASGLVAALRLLPSAAPSFASLNMPLAFDDLIDLPHGLVLVCGAAGSGKSTTLAALAQAALMRRSLLLVTLEDPIEYTLAPGERSLLRRRQIGREVRDFATGLRDALRADPEVLLVGELRDPETIALALTAAETGHLVLSSMHSGSAASAVERIIDAYPAEGQAQVRVQLADALRAIVVLRLLRRARGEGRIPAIEVLRGTHGVSSLIREGKTAQFATVLQSSRREGMISLERCLADRVQAGEVRLEDAKAVANDPDALARYLSRPVT
jgi:twitching motility protein PilT